MESVEMKNFSFRVFYYKTEFFKKIEEDIIATIKTTIRDVKRITLRNEKSIINERDERNRNI